MILIFLVALLWASVATALTLTWRDNSNNEDGFSIEMLSKGTWGEVARVGSNVTTWKDNFTEGVYRVRAFINILNPDGTVASIVFSPYSNTGAQLNGPSQVNVTP